MIITDRDVTRAMLKEAVNIETQIEDLEKSADVRLAMRYNETKGKRLAYLQDLKQLERLGKRLRAVGWEDDYAEDEEGL
jgi:hypothetical protein